MAHKCFISFKSEDAHYKWYMKECMTIDMIDNSLDVPIDSDNEDYIMQSIRRDYLADSTVTIHLIGLYGAECKGAYEQRFIKRELQSSLYNGIGNTRNGILGVVLPDAQANIFKGPYYCIACGLRHNSVELNDNTVIKEFRYNYYIPNEKCAHYEDDRYCVLATWEDFRQNPELYIDLAHGKRNSPIASKVRVYPP